MLNQEAPRHVPYDVLLEQSLLGAIIVSNNTYWRIAETLAPKDFYDGLHERIYRQMDRLAARDDAITPLTLHAAMKSDAGLIEVGGHSYFVSLAQAAPALPNVREYAKILRELAVRRRVISIGEDLVNSAYDKPEETTPEEMATRASEELYEATKGMRASDEGAVNVRELAERAAENAERARIMPRSVCLTSGLEAVDQHLGGIYRGDLTFIGGAPNMGKTSLAEHICWANGQIANPEELPEDVIFFSMEMLAAEIAARQLAQRAKVPSDRMRKGTLSEHESERIFLAAKQFPDMPFFVDGARGLSVAQMRARIQARKRRSKRGGVSLAAIDNLRLIRPANPRDDEKMQIQQITKDLKDMAAELNVAVACIAHLSRDYAKRANNRPQLSDLYGSSSIEQNADAVWFVHREIYYLERNPPQTKNNEEKTAWLTRCEQEKGWAEVFAAKQRMGPIGSARVRFNEQYTQFADAEKAATQEEIALWKGLQSP